MAHPVENPATTAAQPGSVEFPHLLSPLQVGAIELRNRLVMGSMHSGLEDRIRDIPKLAAYLGRRAEGGVGLIVTGGFAPNIEGWLTPAGSMMASKRMARAHQEVTSAVHAHDGRIVLQILHAGRYSYSPLARSASSTKSPISPFKARELSGFDIKRTIGAYVRAAKLAKLAGYDGIEIMGSEGYLLNQFLAERTNHRSDHWGGSAQARMQLPLEIVRRTRAEVGEDFLIQYRISLLDLVEGGQSWSEITDLANGLAAAGVDIFNTGIGWHEARIPTIVTSVPRAAFADVTAKLRREVPVPVAASNRINSPVTAEKLIASGSADLVSMARPLLADPDFLAKTAAGRADEINMCIACNQACLDHTFKNQRATCLVNPKAAYETELVTLPVRTQAAKRVAVIGAGVAGLAYAETAATRGHQVEVFEANDEIGGQFLLAAKIPGKEEYANTLPYFARRLEVLDVAVHTGRRVTVSELLNPTDGSTPFDHVVVATGVNPRIPKIPGIDHPKVVAYDELLSGRATAGKRVAVIGAGGIGVDVSEYLTREPNISVEEWKKEWGVCDPAEARAGLTKPEIEKPEREVHLLQRKTSRIGAGLGKTTGWVHRAELKKAGVRQWTGVTYERIDDDGLHITVAADEATGDTTSDAASNTPAERKPVVLDVDTIVICTGQESNLAALGALDAEVIKNSSAEADTRVTIIGGADVAAELDAKRAIRQAVIEAQAL